MNDFDPYAPILDGSMTQVTENDVVLKGPDEEDIFMYVRQHMEDTSSTKQNSGSFYSQMLPSFREASNWVMSEEDVQSFYTHIYKSVGLMKTKYLGGSANDDHVYISSNVPCETAKTHHGCDGWRDKR